MLEKRKSYVQIWSLIVKKQECRPNVRVVSIRPTYPMWWAWDLYRFQNTCPKPIRPRNVLPRSKLDPTFRLFKKLASGPMKHWKRQDPKLAGRHRPDWHRFHRWLLKAILCVLRKVTLLAFYTFSTWGIYNSSSLSRKLKYIQVFCHSFIEYHSST